MKTSLKSSKDLTKVKCQHSGLTVIETQVASIISTTLGHRPTMLLPTTEGPIGKPTGKGKDWYLLRQKGKSQRVTWVGCANIAQRGTLKLLKSFVTPENGILAIPWVEVYSIRSTLGTHKYSLLIPPDFVENDQFESSEKMNILSTHQEYEGMCALA